MKIQCHHVLSSEDREHIAVTVDGLHVEWYTLNFNGTIFDQSKHCPNNTSWLTFFDNDTLTLLWEVEL